MTKILSLLLTLAFATSGLANYAQLLPHYPAVKECYADAHELSLVPAEQQRVALQVLGNNAQPSTETIPNRDASLFGPAGSVATMNKTHTAFGHAVMASLLASTDKSKSQTRQNAVRLLAQNSQLADELATQLKRFAQAEAVFLKFYKDTAITEQDPSPTWLGLNKNLSLVGSVANICGVAVPLPGPAVLTGALAMASTWALSKFSRFAAPWNFVKRWGGKVTMPYQLNQSYNQLQNNLDNDPDGAARTWRNSALFYSVIWLAAAGYGLWNFSKTLNDMSAHQVPLRALKAGLMAMEEIHRILEQDSRLAQNMPELAALKSIFNPNEHGESFKRLLFNLQEDSFKEPFSITASFGTILTAHKLMQTSARMQLRNAFEAVGKLDAYLAAASLVTEGANGQRYTFAKSFNENSCFACAFGITPA